MLRRFADARLRAVLRRTRRSRAEAREDARMLRRRLAVRDREIGTLRTLLATWQGIARQAQDDLTELRADKETTR